MPPQMCPPTPSGRRGACRFHGGGALGRRKYGAGRNLQITEGSNERNDIVRPGHPEYPACGYRHGAGMYRADRRGAGGGQSAGGAGLPSRTCVPAGERKYLQKCAGSRDPRYGSPRVGSSGGAGLPDRLVRPRAGGAGGRERGDRRPCDGFRRGRRSGYRHCRRSGQTLHPGQRYGSGTYRYGPGGETPYQPRAGRTRLPHGA